METRGLYGYIDLSGRDLVKASFDEAGPFGNGLAPVKNASNYRAWGYVDARGKTVIPHRYNAARAFREGLAPVATDSRWGYIDVLGADGPGRAVRRGPPVPRGAGRRAAGGQMGVHPRAVAPSPREMARNEGAASIRFASIRQQKRG